MNSIELGLDQTANVYTPNGTTGAYTVLAQSALPCRLVRRGGGPMDNRRAEMAADGLLLWGPDYTMSELAQVEVASVRYNIEAGTLAAIRGIGGGVEYRRAEVRRAA